MLLSIVPLLVVLAALLWFGQYQMQRDVAAQADAVGAELSRQVAASVADPLAANDSLSLNILLAQWNQNPLIAHTSLYTADNRIVAEAGERPSRDDLAPGQGRFIASVHFQDVLAGQLQMSLAAEPFSAPGQRMIQRMLVALLVLVLVALVVAWRLADGMRRTLAELGDWHGDSGAPAPGMIRKDEIGNLARRLAERRIVDMPPPLLEERFDEAEEAEMVPEEAALEKTINSSDLDAGDLEEAEQAEQESAELVASVPVQDDIEMLDETDQQSPQQTVATEPDTVISAPAEELPVQTSAVLAVRLGNQEALRRLPRPRLMVLLERYREHIQRASQIYNGHLHTLHDGTSLIIFAQDTDDEELTHALTCGELLRVLGHDLQIEIADTGIALHLQLAVCHATSVDVLDPELFAQQPECAQMLEQVQYSRNLLLLDASLATAERIKTRAVVRRLASQPGIYCIERLVEPYQALLERQLNALYTHRRL
ncbi:MAG TPA: histidine kinase [Pseudomonas xinjiangensis]|uniref:Histidine kinase n=2 Tax=root TaxID=1 RepID=A0A7V1BPG5_9GAMM|nr:histidine kinase [Halopseudomonas xinjiangensis]HEC49478.1 histidine kinase [Halopseudomonas xinjiangensis]